MLDDFAPCELWPPITYGRVDTLREQWLTDERFTAVEVMVAPDASHDHRHAAAEPRRPAGRPPEGDDPAGSHRWVSGPIVRA